MKSDVEDWLTDLPPLDGGDDETDEAGEQDEDLLPEEEGGASLDDSVADDLEIGESIDDAEADPAAGSDDENWQADVGDAELDTQDDEAPWSDADGEGDGSGDGEWDLDDEPEAPDDDRGEEGTTDPIELDEELPALDADAEGDFEDALLSELHAGDTDPRARFADAAWEATTFSAWEWTEDDEIAAMLVQVAPDLVVVLTTAGHVFMSSDGRTPAVRVGAIPEELSGQGQRLFLACSGKRPILWVADGTGQLVKSSDLGQSWTQLAGIGRPILALATHEDGSLSALAHSGTGAEILTSRDGVRWLAQRVASELNLDGAGTRQMLPWLCHRGSATAIGDPLGVFVCRDGTQQYSRIAGVSGASTGAFAGSDGQAPLLLVTSGRDTPDAFGARPGSRALHLVRAAPGEAPEIVAELEPRGMSADGGVLALAWDDAAGGARVGFASELVSVKPRTPYLS
jgi:hypothetical protein